MEQNQQSAAPDNEASQLDRIESMLKQLLANQDKSAELSKAVILDSLDQWDRQDY